MAEGNERVAMGGGYTMITTEWREPIESPLTDKEVEAAIAMHSERLPWKKVAERIGRTQREILCALRDRGIRTLIHWSKEEEDRAMELYKSGKSYKDIGDELARTAHSVATKLSWLAGGYSSSRKASTAIVLHGWGPALVWPTKPRRDEKVEDEEEGAA